METELASLMVTRYLDWLQDTVQERADTAEQSQNQGNEHRVKN
jgi:hypothetical protein